MPTVSIRGKKMPSSPIRKLVPYADSARANGKHIYHLNIGQPDLQTPDTFWSDLKQIDEKVLSYCPSNGLKSYREQFAKYYIANGIQVDESNFIITTGASEALFFGMFSCLDSEDEVIVPEPMYANYISFAQAGNINICPITTTIDNGFALPTIESFEEKINERTKAILICNPNNPTGYLYTKEELDRLSKIVLKHNLFLFVDEVYREFAYDGRKHYSILNYPELADHAVVYDSISKRFSACGARIGALITRNKEILSTAMKFAQARLSPPSLAQMAGMSMFDLGEDFYDEVVNEYSKRRDLLTKRLNEMDNVVCPTSTGALYSMVELPVDDTDHFCQWMLESFDHNGATVMMAPGSGFYANSELGKQQVRIAYVLNCNHLDKAMDCLEAGLKAYQSV